MKELDPGLTARKVLWEVLEEEYRAVRGELPDEYVAEKERIRGKVREGAPPYGNGWDEWEAAEAARVFYRMVHRHDPERAALCLSGGGIRSATFGLGVLQGLARLGVVKWFDYLSTVSGGGYLGSCVSAWIRHQREEGASADAALDGVVTELKGEQQDSVLRPEPGVIEHLREYSNFLSPKLGLLSADTWTLVANFVRNLLLNWLVLIPLFAAALALPRFVVRWVWISAEWDDRTLALWTTRAMLVLGGIGQVLAMAYLDWNRPALSDLREKTEGSGSLRPFKWLAFFPLMAAGLLLPMGWAGIRGAYLTPAELLGLPYREGSWMSAWPDDTVSDLEPWGFVVFNVALSLVSWLCVRVLLVVWQWRKWSAAVPAISHFGSLGALLLSAFVGGLMLWCFARLWFMNPLQKFAMEFATLALPAYLLAFLLAGILLRGLGSAWASEEDREWASRASGWIIAAGLGWLLACGLVLHAPSLLWKYGPAVKAAILGGGGISGAVAAMLAYSRKTPANRDEAGSAGTFSELGLKLAGAAFVGALIIGLALATDALLTRRFLWNTTLTEYPRALEPGVTTYADGSPDARGWHRKVVTESKSRPLALLTLLLASISMGASWFVDINKFSLHAVYRSRLIRAYLGASNVKRRASKKYNAFTDFNPDDDVLLAELRGQRPFHVVNMALNLTATEKRAWQERKAESFTASPLHCGNHHLGYRDSAVYGGAMDALGPSPRPPMTLGTAMAISGAAASPNMGYHSSPIVTLLMTLFNVRLGAWKGNPGVAGEGEVPGVGKMVRRWPTYGKSSPRVANRPLVEEAFGLTTDANPYVNLSDGGHFENLGLYEMVLRRCRFIFVSDAGRDPECAFDDLGNAVRKIRIDLGISITFEPGVSIYGRKDERSRTGRHVALGQIHYRDVDGADAPQGVLVYVKPSFYGNGPIDVFNYASQCSDFPHESTADQFFSESQFESYRSLGVHLVEQILGTAAVKDWTELEDRVRRNLKD